MRHDDCHIPSDISPTPNDRTHSSPKLLGTSTVKCTELAQSAWSALLSSEAEQSASGRADVANIGIWSTNCSAKRSNKAKQICQKTKQMRVQYRLLTANSVVFFGLEYEYQL